MLTSILTQSLLFFPLTLGIYFSYRILQITDLTVEGSFVLGAAIFARLISLSIDPYTASIIAIIGGILSGFFVASLQKKGKISPLIAGILALFMLYSINFQILGQPNISLLGKHTLIGNLQYTNPFLMWSVVGALAIGLSGAIYMLLKSRFGYVFRGYGFNQNLIKKLGHSVMTYRFLGLALSNCLAAICGIFTCQVNGYTDINMGLGMTLTGIGTVVIGIEIVHFFNKKRDEFLPFLEIFCCFLGVVLYFTVVYTLLRLNISPVNLKLFIGLILVLFLRMRRSPMIQGGQA